MSYKVVLKFTKGTWLGREIIVDEKICKSVGRGDISNITLPDEDKVSRLHCLLDINPPSITVKDLGSTNGTYLNDVLIGKKSSDPSGVHTACFPVNTGDRLGLGKQCEITFSIIKDEDDQTEVLEEDEEDKDNDTMQIAGYKYIRILGEGGMGYVWLVEDEQTGKQMVMKYMLPEVSKDEQKRAWFLREARIGERITHTNLVQQYKSGKIGNAYYILMEYCKGGNLVQLMENEAMQILRIDKDDVFEYENFFRGKSDSALKQRIRIASWVILQVLDGLHYLHHVPVIDTFPDGSQCKPGIVHRDIKPENIVLSDTDYTLNTVVKLADFGLAKAFHFAGFSKNTYTNQTAGSTRFIPRQQVIDYRYAEPGVDIWATASIFYYMLCGHPPRDFGKDTNDYTVILTQDAVPIRKREPRIPEKLAEVIDMALIDNPEIVIKSALELKIMINAALSNQDE